MRVPLTASPSSASWRAKGGAGSTNQPHADRGVRDELRKGAAVGGAGDRRGGGGPVPVTELRRILLDVVGSELARLVAEVVQRVLDELVVRDVRPAERSPPFAGEVAERSAALGRRAATRRHPSPCGGELGGRTGRNNCG